jgi:DNA-binding MarR family transcriptional regulator
MAGKQNAARKEREKRPEPGAAAVAVGAAVGAPKLDRLIHERLRLGILSALSVNESLTFNELKKLLDTTDGNLSVHARKLEEAGYLSCTKTFAGRMPRSDYKMSSAGRRALERYLDHMEALIQAMREK